MELPARPPAATVYGQGSWRVDEFQVAIPDPQLAEFAGMTKLATEARILGGPSVDRSRCRSFRLAAVVAEVAARGDPVADGVGCAVRNRLATSTAAPTALRRHEAGPTEIGDGRRLPDLQATSTCAGSPGGSNRLLGGENGRRFGAKDAPDFRGRPKCRRLGAMDCAIRPDALSSASAVRRSEADTTRPVAS